MNKLQIPFALIFFFLCFLLSISFAEDPNPITIGGACSQSDGSYEWITSTRTIWSVSDIYAVPVGTQTPYDWANAEAFHTRLIEVLAPDPTPVQYGEACATISSEFFSTDADILIRLHRTISTTRRNVECVSEVWTVVFQLEGTKDDQSEWLRVGNRSYDVSINSDREMIPQDVQALINQLSAQPGSDTSPVNTYIQVQQ